MRQDLNSQLIRPNPGLTEVRLKSDTATQLPNPHTHTPRSKPALTFLPALIHKLKTTETKLHMFKTHTLAFISTKFRSDLAKRNLSTHIYSFKLSMLPVSFPHLNQTDQTPISGQSFLSKPAPSTQPYKIRFLTPRNQNPSAESLPQPQAGFLQVQSFQIMSKRSEEHTV